MHEADVFEIEISPPPVPPPAPAIERRPSIDLQDLLELAISSKDLGTVNFNVLRLLLSDMISKLDKIDRAPVKLEDNEATQIANYISYMQGEGPPLPGTFHVPSSDQLTPSADSQFPDFRQSSMLHPDYTGSGSGSGPQNSQLIRGHPPTQVKSGHKGHRGKKKMHTPVYQELSHREIHEQEETQVVELKEGSQQTSQDIHPELPVPEVPCDLPPEIKEKDVWWTELDHLDFDQSVQPHDASADPAHSQTGKQQHQEVATELEEINCENCGKPKHAEPVPPIEQAAPVSGQSLGGKQNFNSLGQPLHSTLAGVVGQSQHSSNMQSLGIGLDDNVLEAIRQLQLHEESITHRMEQLEAWFKRLSKDKGMATVNFDKANIVASPPSPSESAKGQGGPKAIEESTDEMDKKAEEDGETVDNEDIQTLFNNLANVIAECADQKDKIEQLIDAVRLIEAGMVTKQYLMDMLGDKADKGQISTKVSYDEFGKTVDELHTQLHNLMIEGAQRNEHWRKVNADFGDELTEKLDKIELAPIRAFFKSRLRKLEDRVNSMAKLLEEPDPIGTRKKLLKDYHCFSCDRQVTMSGTTHACGLPALGGSSALPSSASHRAYDLHRLATLRKNFDPDPKYFYDKDMQKKNQTMSGGRCFTGRSVNDKKNMMEIVSRYVRGSRPKTSVQLGGSASNAPLSTVGNSTITVEQEMKESAGFQPTAVVASSLMDYRRITEE